MLWELFEADIEGIEGIGAIGTVFEKIFFGLRLLLHRLVFAEAVASSLHFCGLDSEDKVIIATEPLLDVVTHIDRKAFYVNVIV